MDLAFDDGGELGVAEGVFANLADESGDGNEGLAGLSRSKPTLRLGKPWLSSRR